ncbi:MAG: hypothetical protein MUF58_00990 [Arcicella sp.]|nr:hypothetical protein [Arcicella sp.]
MIFTTITAKSPLKVIPSSVNRLKNDREKENTRSESYKEQENKGCLKTPFVHSLKG